MEISGLMNGASMVWLDQSGKGDREIDLLYFFFRYLRQHVGSQVLF